MSKRAVETALGVLVAGTWLMVPEARAEGFDPYAVIPSGPIVIDMAEVVSAPRLSGREVQPQPDLKALDRPRPPRSDKPRPPRKMPDGWVQIGEVVMREEIAYGIAEISPEPTPAWEDIEGNQYPRKHTLFLNFNGGVLYGGADNSAENKSTLALAGENYPSWSKSEGAALALIQAVKEDMATLGIVVAYEKRPNKTVPYTMAMIGGDWQDTNLTMPAGGVAPGTDCEAHGQRHVVYVFDDTSSTTGQEAAHAWGLDHTFGSDRIMSYQPGTNKHFGDNCQDLCEEACQGANTIGCRLVHEKYCGVDSEQQNDLAELGFIFGTPEPDTTPPEVKFMSPEGDQVLPEGASVNILGFVHDDYGGVGWKLVVEKDGEVVFDEVDYDRALTWVFNDMPKGVYKVTLEAEDHFEHIVQETVTLYVGVEEPATTGDESGGSGDGSSGGGGSEGEAGTPTSGDVPTEPLGGSSGGGEVGGSTGVDTGQDADDGGCRISSGTGGPAGLLAPLVGGLMAWRARRRR